MLKKIFFISTLFFLTHSSNSSTSTETQSKQEVETKTVKVEDSKPQEIKTDNNNQNVDYLLELYANDKWGFMGKKFIDEFYTKYNSGKAKMNFRAVVMLGGLLGLISFAIAISTEQKELVALWAIYGIPYPLLILFMNESIKSQTIERNKSTLENFLLNWDTYKKATPEQLHSFFENLITSFKNLNDDEIAELIYEIQDQVINNNLKYYELYCRGFNLVY